MRFLFVLLCCFSLASAKSIDVCIPCCPKDVPTLDTCIESIRQYGQNIRNIYVISEYPMTKKAKWIPESIFPFSKGSIAQLMFPSTREAQKHLNNPKNRVGWIYQQLLKFYLPFAMESLSDDYVVIDADVAFIQNTTFLSPEGQPLYNYIEDVFHAPYFEHAKKLIPSFEKKSPYSGICHYMLLQRDVLKQLFQVVESHHRKDFWVAFIDCIDKKQLYASPTSEFEIYFNFIQQKNIPMALQKLRWLDVVSLDEKEQWAKYDCHYVSCHHYLRQPKALNKS